MKCFSIFLITRSVINRDINNKLEKYNRLERVIKQHFDKQISVTTKFGNDELNTSRSSQKRSSGTYKNVTVWWLISIAYLPCTVCAIPCIIFNDGLEPYSTVQCH